MGASKAVWYVMVGGKKEGPLTRVELGVEAATGRIGSQSQVWKEGMEEWCAAGDIPDLAPLFTRKKKEFIPSSQKRAPPPKKNEKGAGTNDFDTAHFRLAELPPEDKATSRQMDLDTSHFHLAELKPEETVLNRNTEFDTAHFRLADMAPEDSGQNAHAADIFRYAAGEMAKEEKDAKQTPHPPAAPKRDLPPPSIPLPRTTASGSAPFIWPSVAIGAILAAALALLLLWD